MADRQVTATLTIGFGAVSVAAGDDTLIAEVDSRDEGFNEGKSSFIPGDDVFILVYQAENVTIDAVIASLGTIALQNSLSPETVELTESITFPNEPDANVSRPIVVIQGNVWRGTNLGAIVKSGETQISLSSPPVVTPYAGVNEVQYDSQATVYKLSNTLLPGVSEYDIVVVFLGTAT